MKILYAGLLLMIWEGNVFGQNRANIWQLGTAPQSYAINFNPGFADTFRLIRKLNFFITNASICDTNGNLLFYTNGVWIANRNHDQLFHSKDFNAGYSTDFYGDDGLGFSQGAIAIPEPGTDAKYFIFYITGDTFTTYNQFQVQPTHLSYSEIDMTLDSNLGGIVPKKKNIHIIEDTVSQGRITACKHANGRDWWVITHKFHSNLYYKILVRPDTMIVNTQAIGNDFTSNDIDGMAAFSPDGLKYAQININDSIDILDFDRCTGEFSNPRTLIVPDSGALSGTLGCSFSPNSRFLYANSYLELWQFDTEAEDPNQSRILIDTISIDSIFQWLFTDQLAPDGKIYINTFNGNDKLSVINNPDSLGSASNFKVTNFDLPPPYDNLSLPNFPNYDLGPLQGSGCDTIVTSSANTQNAVANYRVYPNPARDWINIVYNSNDDAMFELYDLYGRKVAALSLFHYFKNRLLNVGNLTDGMYEWRVQRSGKILSSGKVAVMK